MSPLLVSLAVATAVFIFIGALYLSAFSGYRKRLENVTPKKPVNSSVKPAYIPKIRKDRAPTITSALRGSSLSKQLQAQLLQAGWLLRPSEFILLISFLGVSFGLILFLIIKPPILALVGVVIGVMLPFGFLSSSRQSRNRQLSRQLPDALDMIASALRSGFSITAGLQEVAHQMTSPLSDEITRVLDEVRFGVPLPKALAHMVARTANRDIDIVVAAMQTHFQLGGNLSEVLDNVAIVIRERIHLQGEIDTATGQGKLSASILMMMPLILAMIVQFLNPGYLEPLYKTTMGMQLMFAGAALMILGYFGMRSVTNIDI